MSPPKVNLTRSGNSSPGNDTAFISLLITASVVSWFASFSSCFTMPSKLVQAERVFFVVFIFLPSPSVALEWLL